MYICDHKNNIEMSNKSLRKFYVSGSNVCIWTNLTFLVSLTVTTPCRSYRRVALL